MFSKVFKVGIYLENTRYYKDESCKILHNENGFAIRYKFFNETYYFDYKSCTTIYYRGEYYLNGIKYSEKEYWTKIRFGDFI